MFATVKSKDTDLTAKITIENPYKVESSIGLDSNEKLDSLQYSIIQSSNNIKDLKDSITKQIDKYVQDK